ncbi:MAG TPA: ROK family protein [Terriglobales bacterium]|nr:ROK family protein [Terriglobales bacterium]
MACLAIGVDLGGTNLRVAAVTGTGQTLEVLRSATPLSLGREYVIEEIAAEVRTLAQKFRAAHRLMGIGIGVPGILDLASGTLHSAANLPGWDHYPVRAILEEKLGVPVVLENDANCAALGEKWLGAGRDVEDLCMLTLGTGVGGGFVFNGRPWHGMAGMAGEIGHMTVIPEGAACGCGNRGCLEQYASATAVVRLASEMIAQGKAPRLQRALKQTGPLTSRTVFEAARQGDATALEIFDVVGRALGIVLANLVNALNLPLYVIGGGLAEAWEVFSPALFRELHHRSVVFSAGENGGAGLRATRIVPAELHESAGLLGAARLPMLLEKSCNFRSLAV